MARMDPYRNFNFIVEIGGIKQAGFSDCTGFGASTDPIEYREGSPESESNDHAKTTGNDQVSQHYVEMGHYRFARDV